MIKLTIFCVIISIIISFVLSIPYECKDLSNTNCTACLNIKGCSYCKKTEQCFPSSLSAPCPTADLQFQTCFGKLNKTIFEYNFLLKTIDFS